MHLLNNKIQRDKRKIGKSFYALEAQLFSCTVRIRLGTKMIMSMVLGLQWLLVLLLFDYIMESSSGFNIQFIFLQKKKVERGYSFPHIHFSVAIWRDVYVTGNCIGYSLHGKCPSQARAWILDPSLVVLFGEITYPLRWEGYLKGGSQEADGDSLGPAPCPNSPFLSDTMMTSVISGICCHRLTHHPPHLPHQDGTQPLTLWPFLLLIYSFIYWGAVLR